MLFVVGNLRKLFLNVKTKPEIFLIAFAVALIIAGWRFWDYHRKVSHTHIKISMKSSIDGTAQLYYDLGSGLTEKDSVSVFVTGDKIYHDYQFQLPKQPVYGSRFDPLMSEGSISIRHVALLDGLGAFMQSISLKQLLPLNQIGSFTLTDQGIDIVTNQQANDPQIGVQLSRPITADRGFFLWRHPAVILRILVEFVAVFVVITILWFFWPVCRKKITVMNHGGKIPFAILLSFLIVITIEIVQQARLPATASYHEVDQLLYQLKMQRIDADYMLLGDSVGRQLFNNTPHLQNKEYAMLATNQAITMTGQYFIAKRYLELNKTPRAVILLTTHYFGTLDQNLTDNYIQRTFTNFSEIFNVFHLKRDPVFAAKMIAYRLLPSFKYRLFLQKQLVTFTNAESYTGIAHDNKQEHKSQYSLLRIMKSCAENKDISRNNFRSFLMLLNNLKIPIFFIVPAINEERNEFRLEYRELCNGLFPELKKRYPFFYYDDDGHLLGAEYYVDGVHFNDAGLKIETQLLREKIHKIQSVVNENKIYVSKIPLYRSHF